MDNQMNKSINDVVKFKIILCEETKLVTLFKMRMRIDCNFE